MATVVSSPRTLVKPASLPGRRFDHVFFFATALLMLAAVFLGFARTYYLAGVFRAPLPSTIIHVHGAVFSCWILLVLAQTSLTSAGRVDIHRRLGVLGFLLAGLMVVLGIWAATERLAHGTNRADPYLFYIVPLTDMLNFATLVFFAFRARFDSAAHKRIMYVATTALLIAPIARWPVSFLYKSAAHAALISCLFVLLLVAYDLWSTHKIHRATIWAGGFLILVQQIRLPIGKTAAWHSFAAWVQSMAR